MLEREGQASNSSTSRAVFPFIAVASEVNFVDPL